MVERVHELESPRSNLAVGVVCASSLVSCMTMSLVLRRPGFEPIFNHTWLACLLHCCIFSLETIHTIVPMKSSEHVLIVHLSLGTNYLVSHRFDPGLSEWERRKQYNCGSSCTCLQSLARVVVEFFRWSPSSIPGYIRMPPGSLCLKETSVDECLEDITFGCIHDG